MIGRENFENIDFENSEMKYQIQWKNKVSIGKNIEGQI